MQLLVPRGEGEGYGLEQAPLKKFSINSDALLYCKGRNFPPNGKISLEGDLKITIISRHVSEPFITILLLSATILQGILKSTHSKCILLNKFSVVNIISRT